MMEVIGGRVRPDGDIIRMVETFAEARELLEPLARRDIGAIGLKGVASGKPTEFWAENSELRSFAYDASYATRGLLAPDIYLEIRRLPRKHKIYEHGNMTIFKGDIDMHIDGYSEEIFDQDGKLEKINSRKPLLSPLDYLGVSHHITRNGSTVFALNKLTNYATRELTRNHERINLGVTDTNPINPLLQGEVVQLEQGDYLAVHTCSVRTLPVYSHATFASSPERRSITFGPVPTETLDMMHLDLQQEVFRFADTTAT